MSEQLAFDLTAQAQAIKPAGPPEPPRETGLDHMGTTGLADFVVHGGPQLFYERLALAVSVIGTRYGQRGAYHFYRLIDRTTPDKTMATLKRWRQERIEAADLRDNWIQSKELAARWAVEIREAWLKRKPCPIIPNFWYEGVLQMAFDLAGIPQSASFVPQEKEEK